MLNAVDKSDGWHVLFGYCVYLKDDYVVKYFRADDSTAQVVVPEKPLKWSAFKMRVWRAKKVNQE